MFFGPSSFEIPVPCWIFFKIKDWNTLFGTTPAHPDFPSGHSATAGAAEVILTRLFGENYAFTNHTYDYLGMPPQAYTSFSDMAQQIGLSRLYSGIHTRYACDVARGMGNKIAQNTIGTISIIHRRACHMDLPDFFQSSVVALFSVWSI
jgi:hypothetical protein